MLRLLSWPKGDYTDEFAFALSDRENHVACLDAVVLKPYKTGDMLTEMVSLKPDAVQILFDSLWRHGMRPSRKLADIQGNNYLERHLEDMRAIVQDRLKVKLPGGETGE